MLDETKAEQTKDYEGMIERLDTLLTKVKSSSSSLDESFNLLDEAVDLALNALDRIEQNYYKKKDQHNDSNITE